MADQAKKIYDDDSSEQPITRPDLRALEGGGQTSAPKRGHLRVADDEEEPKSLSPEEIKEKEDATGTSSESGDSEDSKPSDQVGRGFKADDGKSRFRGGWKGFKHKRKLAVGAGGSLALILVVMAGLFGFLNVFKLDHFLQNIDTKTMARFNASFSNRSDSYTRAYVRLRMMQIEGAVPTDPNSNLYFRANTVDTDNPAFDWYKTMYTSDFEKDLREKNGIVFTSVAVPKEGGGFKLRAGKITIKGDEDGGVDFDTINRLNRLDPTILDQLTSGDLSQLATGVNKLGPDLDKFVQTEIFDSDKSARREIKNTVKSNTRFFEVLKRRRLRKNIQNMIGVRDWQFFEKTAAKYESKKTDIQRKILKKTLPGNTELGKFMQCIFIGECNTRNDPVNPSGESTSISDANTEQNETEAVDNEGNRITETRNNGGEELITDTTAAIDEEIALDEVPGDGTSGSTRDSSTITARLIKKIVGKFVDETVADTTTAAAGDVTKWWNLAKRIAKLDRMFRDGHISKMVKAAKLAQYIGLYTMLATARDQVKTGELSGAEMQDLMVTLEGFDKSEGWEMLNKKDTGGTVSAASVTPAAGTISKDEYCNNGHKKEKNEYAYYCDDQKPNSGGRAGDIEAAYEKSVGFLFGPIAEVVGTLKSLPGAGLLDWAAGLVGQITSKLASITIGPALEALGVTQNIGKLITYGMEKFMTFAGVLPAWTGSEPGVANFALTGSSGVAEASARMAGGVASTPKTLSYTNNEAVAYLNEQYKNQSLVTRYASLNNPDSLVAKATFAVANTSLPKTTAFLASSFSKLPSLVGNLFTGRLFAQAATGPSSTIADFAGVDTYDIPEQCQEIDPFSTDYLQRAVGVETSSDSAAQATTVLEAVRGDITIDVARDESAFWKLIYDKIGANNKDAESIAGAIYNCALLDKQVEGGLGYLYGYSNDGGLEN